MNILPETAHTLLSMWKEWERQKTPISGIHDSIVMYVGHRWAYDRPRKLKSSIRNKTAFDGWLSECDIKVHSMIGTVLRVLEK